MLPETSSEPAAPIRHCPPPVASDVLQEVQQVGLLDIRLRHVLAQCRHALLRLEHLLELGEPGLSCGRRGSSSAVPLDSDHRLFSPWRWRAADGRCRRRLTDNKQNGLSAL